MFTGHCPLTGVQIMSTTFTSSLQIRNKGKENNITFPRRSCVLYLYLSWPSQYFKKHRSDLWPVVEKACTFVVTQGRKSKNTVPVRSANTRHQLKSRLNTRRNLSYRNPDVSVGRGDNGHVISRNCWYPMNLRQALPIFKEALTRVQYHQMAGTFWCQAISSLADSLTSTVESGLIRKISAFWSDGNYFNGFLRPPRLAVWIPDKPSAEVQRRQVLRRDVDSDQGINPSSVKTISRKINKARNSCTDV